MNELKSPVQPTIVEMMAGIGTGAKELAAAHAEQFREEVSAESSRATSAIALIAAGCTAVGIGLIFTLVALVMVLIERLGWSAWSAWLAVAAGAVLIGVPVGLTGYRRLQQVHVIPRDTLESVRESLSWIANANR